MARPAASAEVQPSGRRLFVFMSKNAPEPAVHRVPSQHRRVELVEELVVPVHDEHVAVAVDALLPGVAALDPVRLRDGLVGDRVEREALPGRVVDAVALVGVLELHGLLRLAAVHDDVRDAVDLAAAPDRCPPKSGCSWRVGADEPDERRGRRVDRRRADVDVPPVVRREAAAAGTGRRPAADRLRPRAERREQGRGQRQDAPRSQFASWRRS